MVSVKFCGNRRLEDVALLNACKPDYMGMILSAGFCRSIDAATAAAMTAQLDPVIRRVGVVVNESPEQAAALAEAAGADILQLHGQEDAAYCPAKTMAGLHLESRSRANGRRFTGSRCNGC